MNDPKQCDPARVAALLTGDVDVLEQAQIEQHVETCEICQKTLAASASDDGEWTAASRHLQNDEHDGGLSVLSANPAKGSRKVSKEDIDHAVEIRSTDSATAVVVRQIIGWLDPTDDPRMLGRLGGYEIAGVIGSGGMGVVLKGFDASLNRFVAIKLLAPHLAGNGASRQRFAREAQAAAAVVHENVIAIHSVSDFNDLPYLVMPYVRGMSLQKRIDVEGPMELEEILRIGMQTASGLAAAHAQGLVHRDIKPANILLADGVARVTITDFGLARAADDASLTHSGLIAGTPQYMSPEQASGTTVDHRSDLYSLGSLMYAMCAGRPPFRADSAYGILKRIAEESARPIQEVNPKVPDWLARIIAKLHQRDPNNRFRTATELEQLLSDCLAHVQQPTRVPLPHGLKHLTKPPQGHSRWRIAATVLGVGLGLGTIGALGLQVYQRGDKQSPVEQLAKVDADIEPAESLGVQDLSAGGNQPDDSFYPSAEPNISDLSAAVIRFEIRGLETAVTAIEHSIEPIEPTPNFSDIDASPVPFPSEFEPGFQPTPPDFEDGVIGQ
jgi:serine/threonine-protein kinase